MVHLRLCLIVLLIVLLTVLLIECKQVHVLIGSYTLEATQYGNVIVLRHVPPEIKEIWLVPQNNPLEEYQLKGLTDEKGVLTGVIIWDYSSGFFRNTTKDVPFKGYTILKEI